MCAAWMDGMRVVGLVDCRFGWFSVFVSLVFLSSDPPQHFGLV